MRPELLRIPLPDWSWLPIDSLPIRGYGAMLALGFLAAIMVAVRRARREGENPDHIYNAAIIALLGGVFGARLFDVIEYANQPPDFRYQNWLLGFNLLDGLAPLWLAVGAAAGAAMAFLGVLPWSRSKDGRLRWAAVAAWAAAAGLVLGRAAYIHGVRAALAPGAADPYAGFIDALKITSGGLTVYGGLMLAVAVFVPYLVYLRYRHGVNPLKLLDIIAPSLALGLAFGRMGCLLNGCCWGAECHLPWAITWAEGTLPYSAGIRWPVHPAQVYGIINGLLLFLALHLGYRWKKRHGVVLGAFFGLYAVSRFLLECVRSDEPKRFLWGLSISQTVALFMVVAVAAYFLWLRKSRMSDLLWQAPAADANRPSRAERRRAKRRK